jgi:hypothetical protein
MVVQKGKARQALEELAKEPALGLDTETFGLDEEDRLFSIIVASEKQSYYFNFYQGLDHLGNQAPSDCILSHDNLRPWFSSLFAKEGVWFIHNALFDMQKLWLEGFSIEGQVHCTQSCERLLNNDLLPNQFSLEATAKRYGFKKDSRVEEYIDKHGLKLPKRPQDKKARKKFYEVPFAMMAEYGIQDGRLHYDIGMKQRELIHAGSV